MLTVTTHSRPITHPLPARTAIRQRRRVNPWIWNGPAGLPLPEAPCPRPVWGQPPTRRRTARPAQPRRYHHTAIRYRDWWRPYVAGQWQPPAPPENRYVTTIYVYRGPEAVALGDGDYFCDGRPARLHAVLGQREAHFVREPHVPPELADMADLADLARPPTIYHELTTLPKPVDWRTYPVRPQHRPAKPPAHPVIPTAEWIMELMPRPPALFWVLQLLTLIFWRAPGHALWRWLDPLISHWPLWTAPAEIQTIARIWAEGRPVTWDPIYFERYWSLDGDPSRVLCSLAGPGYWDEWHVLARDVWAAREGRLEELARRKEGFAEDIRRLNARRTAEGWAPLPPYEEVLSPEVTS